MYGGTIPQAFLQFSRIGKPAQTGTVRKPSAKGGSPMTARMEKESSSVEIPDKLYFPIREAAKIIGVEAYVLRFWEKEFSAFRPIKGGSGHRRYRKKDMEMALQIKQLLYDQ